MIVFELFAKGLAVGFAVAAPVGPVGVLCVRRTLSEGRLVGLVSGLGAALADAFYGAVAALGVAAVASFLLAHLVALRLIGGVILCLIGYRTFQAQPARPTAGSAEAVSLVGAFGSTFLLTLTNPLTILSFAAIFASLGLGEAASEPAAAAVLIGGVFLGSAIWWLGLAAGVGAFRRTIGITLMRRINQASGMLIGAFGLVALYFGIAPLVAS